MLKHNRKGQGTTEYIIIIAVVAALILLLWPNVLKPAIMQKANKAAQDIGQVR